jgi:hypothetical protein
MPAAAEFGIDVERVGAVKVDVVTLGGVRCAAIS